MFKPRASLFLIIGLLGGFMLSCARPWRGILTPRPEDPLCLSPEIIAGGLGSEYAPQVIATRDGGFAITGRTNSKGAGGYDVWLFKLNSAGELDWQRTYGGARDENVAGIIQTGDGGYALLATTHSKGAGGRDLWIVKTDHDGHMLWEKTLGSRKWDHALALAETRRGRLLVAGRFGSWRGSELFIWKFERDGEQVERKQLVTSGKNDRVKAIRFTRDDGWLALGRRIGRRGFIIRYDAKGGLLWRGELTISGYFWPTVIETADGGFAFAGNRKGSPTLWRYDNKGTKLWVKRLAKKGDVKSVVEAGGRGFLVAGWKFMVKKSLSHDLWFSRVGAKGRILWQKTIPARGGHEKYPSLARAGEGGYVVAGTTDRWSTRGSDFWIVRLNSKAKPIPFCGEATQ